MGYERDIADRIVAKFWDFPTDVDEMRITSYDVNANPLVVEYFYTGRLRFKHLLTYDVDGNLTVKKLLRIK